MKDAAAPPASRWKVRALVLLAFILAITAYTLWPRFVPPSLEGRMTAMMIEQGTSRQLVASAFANTLPSRCTGTLSVRVSEWHAYETTALNAAVITQDLELIKTALSWGCDVNAPDRHGTTPLMIASGSIYRHDIHQEVEHVNRPTVEVVEFFLAKGASLVPATPPTTARCRTSSTPTEPAFFKSFSATAAIQRQLSAKAKRSAAARVPEVRARGSSAPSLPIRN